MYFSGAEIVRLTGRMRILEPQLDGEPLKTNDVAITKDLADMSSALAIRLVKILGPQACISFSNKINFIYKTQCSGGNLDFMIVLYQIASVVNALYTCFRVGRKSRFLASLRVTCYGKRA